LINLIRNWRSFNLETVFTKLDPHQSVLSRPGKPIYISTAQFRDAYYIPEEDRDRIVIVDFKEKEND
jgi:hypothetical protein